MIQYIYILHYNVRFIQSRFGLCHGRCASFSQAYQACLRPARSCFYACSTAKRGVKEASLGVDRSDFALR